MITTGPHKQTRDFFIRRAEGFYSQIKNGRNLRMFNRPVMLENIQYTLGEQDRMRYKKRPDEITQNDRLTLPTSDWRNSKLLWKIFTTVVNLISKQKMMPQVSGIDALARTSKKEWEIELKLASILKKIGGAYEVVANNIGVDPSQVPVTTDGLQVKLSMAPQLREEMSLEIGIQKLLNLYGYADTEIEQIKSNLTCNIGGCVNDLDSCMPNIRNFNPLNGICDFTNKENCRDIKEAAEVILVTLSDLEAYAKNDFVDWQVVVSQARTYDQIVNMPGYSGLTFMGGYQADEAVKYVPVLHASWKETREVCYKEVELPDGTTKAFLELDTDITRDKRNVLDYESKPYEFVFTVKHIINTQEYYDTGLLEPQIRFLPVNNPKDRTVVDPRTSELNWILTNPNVLFGRAISLIEQFKPDMDSLERALSKANSVLQALIPQSIEIDMDALADLELGGETRAKDQLLAMYERKGILLVQKRLMRSGPNESGKAISIIPNNMSDILERLLNVVDRFESKIERMSGIASTEMGQSAGNRVSQGLNQAMIDGQNNVLGGYYRARIQTYERLTFQLMIRLMHTGDEGVHDGIEYSIDKDEMRYRLFNTTTQLMPTDEQWGQLQEAAYNAYYKAVPREIDFSDLMIIQGGAQKNYKQLAAFFAEKEIQRKAENQAKEERNIELNNTGAADAADRKAKGDVQKIQAKEEMVNQRTELTEQAKGMTKEAEIDNSKILEYLQILKVTNPQMAADYAAIKLGLDPEKYRAQVNDLVESEANPPQKEQVAA